MLSANSAKAHGHLKASAPSKLYGQAAITHSADDRGGTGWPEVLTHLLRPFLDAMPVLADPGYEGAGHGVHVPVKKPTGVAELDIDTRARNALLRSVRCLGERGFALLTQRWKTLQHVTASPGRIGLIARAAFVLVLFEQMIK